MKDGIKYKGVITDPRDGETVAVEIATVRSGDHSPAQDLPIQQDAFAEPLAQDTASEPAMVDAEPVVVAEPPEAQPTPTEVPVVLDGKYAAIRDAVRQRGQQLAANIGPAAAAARPWLADRATQLAAAAAIATEEYQDGKPKPRSKPKPPPKPHPKVGEVSDKYKRIMQLFRPAAPEAQTRPRRSRNAGMKTRTARVPSVKVVTKR